MDDVEFFERALRDGERYRDQGDGAEVRIAISEAGRLEAPSGKIVVSDPCALAEAQPLDVAIARGEHPVRMATLRCAEEKLLDRTVALACLTLREGKIVEWKAGAVDSVGVDTGNACFADLTAARALADHYDRWVDKGLIAGASWTRRRKRGGTIVGVHTGLGDGNYPIAIGHDARGNACAVAIDFQMIQFEAPPVEAPPPEMPEVTITIPVDASARRPIPELAALGVRLSVRPWQVQPEDSPDSAVRYRLESAKRDAPLPVDVVKVELVGPDGALIDIHHFTISLGVGVADHGGPVPAGSSLRITLRTH